ncbi:LPS-assembly protein LptD [Ideonella sp. B7]|uniref:LPS-assembly protein LptD n=1 Tax=Ideonella benzenivorans TaxID=2831643 RepID=UPI001CECCD6E|nr:LPS assembly protein LptD [Ideonella benzenivorans]MCA6215350.1 LPS-assembly protein LptD [Ideonella benzenivorans]
MSRALMAAGVLSAGALLALPARAQSGAAIPVPATPVPDPAASAPFGQLVATDAPNGPAQLTANTVHSVLDGESVAVGEVELRRGGLVLTADQLRYLQPSQLAIAEGHVTLRNQGDRFTGTTAQLHLDSNAGTVAQPTYFFGRTQAGGQAARIDFDSPQRLHAYDASYSSCRPGDGQQPDWELRMDQLDLDFDQNEGLARGAVLHFLGVPILAAPVMSFPATAAAKSGLLAPTFNIDSRGGFEYGQPYYWRLAPNYDLTLGPVLSTRRDAALLGEFRYLGAHDSGRIAAHYLPFDRTIDHQRYSVQAEHYGDDGDGLRYELSYRDASDDRYWKDFSGMLSTPTPRLLSQAAGVAKQWALDRGDVTLYARAQGWRTLQDPDNPIVVPYERAPQLGLQLNLGLMQGIDFSLETEANRFVLADRTADDNRPEGNRGHLLAAVSRRFDNGWGWLTPKASLNYASYSLDQPMSNGRQHASRGIPTFSLDSGLRMARDVSWFGAGLTQTLEPRLHYVFTPYRDQSLLPEFDTAASDFNSMSIYQDNEFTGIDRVSDEHQVTVGATTRFLDDQSGIERLRFGAAQRFQFRDQRLTASGTPSTKRASDLLLFASGQLTPAWSMDTMLQYNSDIHSSERTILSTRYSPGPFQTIAGTYRYTRGSSEQFELGVQWPLYRGGGTGSSGRCQGTLYGVGRVNYSMKDQKVTDSVAGIEYDAGCWILRVVNSRQSTGQSEATQRWMIQLELVGLSSLGTNPLQVLKDNIPGYRLLRDEGAGLSPTSETP